MWERAYSRTSGKLSSPANNAIIVLWHNYSASVTLLQQRRPQMQPLTALSYKTSLDTNTKSHSTFLLSIHMMIYHQPFQIFKESCFYNSGGGGGGVINVAAMVLYRALSKAIAHTKHYLRWMLTLMLSDCNA